MLGKQLKAINLRAEHLKNAYNNLINEIEGLTLNHSNIMETKMEEQHELKRVNEKFKQNVLDSNKMIHEFKIKAQDNFIIQVKKIEEEKSKSFENLKNQLFAQLKEKEDQIQMLKNAQNSQAKILAINNNILSPTTYDQTTKITPLNILSPQTEPVIPEKNLAENETVRNNSECPSPNSQTLKIQINRIASTRPSISSESKSPVSASAKAKRVPLDVIWKNYLAKNGVYL